MKDEIPYALRLPKKLHADLKRIAKDTDRSLNYVIVLACAAYAEVQKSMKPRKS